MVSIAPPPPLCKTRKERNTTQEVNAILTRWNALQPLQQMDLCAAAIKWYNKRTTPNMRKRLDNVTEDLMQEAWLGLCERMDPAALVSAVEKADRENRRPPP